MVRELIHKVSNSVIYMIVDVLSLQFDHYTCRIFADLPISVKMRGPYGSLMIDIYNPKYKDLIFIAGGVGAAVVQSMIEALIFYYMNYTTEDGFVPSIKLVIVSQNRSLYEFINKRLEYYSTCKRPRITLDLYWTSKFMKYLEADKTKEVLTVTDNQLSSKPSETPFELLTENILKPADINAEEKTYEPVDGYVSDSYKALVSKPVVFKPAVSSTITTQAVTPNVLSELKSLETEDKNDNIEMSKSSSKKSKRKNADALTESTTTPNNRPASADDRPSKNLKKHKKLAEKPQGVIDAVISSRINQSKEQSEKNTPRLNSESIENVDMTTDVKGNPDITGSLDVAAGNPSSKTKNAKKSKKKNDEVCHDSRLQNCSVDSPGDVFSLSSDKTGSTMRSKKKGSRKYDEDDDNFRIDADSLDSIAVSTLKASPSKKSKSSSQKNTRNITIDDDDSVFMEDNFSDFVLSLEQETSVSTPVVNPSESKSKKPSSRKGNRKSDVIDANDGNANLVAASESLLTVETNVGTASERLFTPSRKSPNTIDEERPLQLNEGSLMDDGTWDSGAVLRPTPGSPVNSAVAFTTPGSEERFSSKHISFGPVPEPPKSRLEDFIVYEHFYENILKRGRPNVEDIILNGINGEFSSGARGHHDGDGMFSNQAVIVCAPPSLIAATRAVCSMYNIDMHDQVFDYN